MTYDRKLADKKYREKRKLERDATQNITIAEIVKNDDKTTTPTKADIIPTISVDIPPKADEDVVEMTEEQVEEMINKRVEEKLFF